jgi:hypothetical protein
MNIPDFAPNGTLPPYVDGNPTDPAKRSPFESDMNGLVSRFCTSKQRAKLLLGLNSYRRHLFEGGFLQGCQWIDGSFVEDVERTQSRSPNDIDVVTLFHRPLKYQINPSKWKLDFEKELHEKFFHTKLMKPVYFCDTYAVDLDHDVDALVRSTSYWSGLFSDIRGSMEKKGLVKIPLPLDVMEFSAIESIIGGLYDV